MIADGLHRVDAKDGPFWIVSKRRETLYARGIKRRLEKLGRSYGARKLAEQFDGKVVIDVGSNVGEFALFARRHGAIVHAVEPDPVAHLGLVANAADKGIHCHEIALWNKAGRLPFSLATESADSSFMLNRPDNVIEVKADTLAHFMDEQQIERVFFIKADVEGAEPELLEGAVPAFGRISYFSLDCGPERHGETTIKACRKLLKSHFNVVQLAQKRCILLCKAK